MQTDTHARAYARALELDPRDHIATTNLGAAQLASHELRHAINTLVKIVSHAQRNFDTETPLLVLSELLVFLSRPGTKPSHRIYCMGFLNKFATMDASSETAVRAQLLRIYFGLFNKLLHTGEKFDMEAEQKKLKKDRTMGKKERIKALRKLSSQSRKP